MSKRDEQVTRAGGPMILYALAILAIVAFVAVGAGLFAKTDFKKGLTALDQGDLRVIDEKSRLPSGFTPIADAAGPWAVEAEVYVPVYSTVYAGEGSLRSNLAATLSIRNTSHDKFIVVRDVRYFDTDGNLVSNFVDRPHRLGPMATADFFIDSTDVRGGTGANFIVDWAAETAVSEPVIEVVMIGSIGAKGISFISRGTRVKTVPANANPVAD